VRLILIRHPKLLCEQGICYGRFDLECDQQALEEAVHHLAELTETAGRLITSPARRALDLARRLSANVSADPRLQELDFGDWEGRAWSDIDPAAIDAWRRGLPDAAPPNGESLSALGARCAAWLADAERDGTPVLAITHAGPIRVIRALLEGKPLLTYFSTPVPYGEPLTLEFVF
jgi:alpha-ribazole phosphatase